MSPLLLLALVTTEVLSRILLTFSEETLNFPDGGRYHVETSPLICSANQWTGFYMITLSVRKELMENFFFCAVCI